MNSANTPMNILSYDLKLQHHNYNSPLAIKLFLAKLGRYNHARDTVANRVGNPALDGKRLQKDPRTPETMRKVCGNGAERLRKDRGNSAGTKLQWRRNRSGRSGFGRYTF